MIAVICFELLNNLFTELTVHACNNNFSCILLQCLSDFCFACRPHSAKPKPYMLACVACTSVSFSSVRALSYCHMVIMCLLSSDSVNKMNFLKPHPANV